MHPKSFEQHITPSITLAKSLLQNAEIHWANSSSWDKNYKEHAGEIENHCSEGTRLVSKIKGLQSQNDALSQFRDSS
jgi:hypothetical protein